MIIKNDIGCIIGEGFFNLLKVKVWLNDRHQVFSFGYRSFFNTTDVYEKCGVLWSSPWNIKPQEAFHFLECIHLFYQLYQLVWKVSNATNRLISPTEFKSSHLHELSLSRISGQTVGSYSSSNPNNNQRGPMSHQVILVDSSQEI